METRFEKKQVVVDERENKDLEFFYQDEKILIIKTDKSIWNNTPPSVKLEIKSTGTPKL